MSDVREDENGESRNWGKRGNKKLHGWEFDRFTRLLGYKAEEHGILVKYLGVKPRDTRLDIL
ncbi:hypothetical protein GCM10008995_24940 [Halobellus salinus]|uniref:Uncharacterized protein n=1 Tax=Halobellus salinus TaxID=931585 RepID=A0A830ERC6_9EURY|nr:hypothetical protein GCM10008995_24940 [Halobellus salinus]